MRTLIRLARLLSALTILGSSSGGWAMAGELDGFSLKTDDQALTIQLNTSERVRYRTERKGSQLSVILEDTRFSESYRKRGTPVVVDNHNRLIGQAVSAGDGQVRIVIPNLPHANYAISVAQEPAVAPAQPTPSPGEPVAKSAEAAFLLDSRFDRLLHDVKQSRTAAVKSPVSQRAPRSRQATSAPPRQRMASVSPSRLSARPSPPPSPATTSIFPPSDEAIANLSLGEVESGPSGVQPADDLTLETSGDAETQEKLNAPSDASKITQRASRAEPRVVYDKALADAALAAKTVMPDWLLIMIAICMGCIGLTCLVVGVAILRYLFVQQRQLSQPIPAGPESSAHVADPRHSATSPSDLLFGDLDTVHAEPLNPLHVPPPVMHPRKPSKTVSTPAAGDYWMPTPRSVREALETSMGRNRPLSLKRGGAQADTSPIRQIVSASRTAAFRDKLAR